jgi:CBS domain-containing protein
MQHRMEEVMTTDVVVVKESTPFREITHLLRTHHISAVPVVDPVGRVAGVVSETDLLKAQYPPDGGGGQGTAAADLMTSPAITVLPTTTVAEAAKLMQTSHVNRLPVVDLIDDALVGIVTRSDLLKVFDRSDDEIRSEIVDDVILRNGMDPRTFRVQVQDGIVTLEGRVGRRSLVPILVDLVHRVDGVVDVRSRLGFELDDDDPMLPKLRRRAYAASH